MSTEPDQPTPLPPLTTTNIPSPKYDDLTVSPPPAYCPPEGMSGPPFAFLRTASFPVQYGAYDAYTTHQSSSPSTTTISPEQLTPEAQALVDQYTVYFTELFTSWISYAVLFWKYGVPAVKWSALFFIRGLGGWREVFLLSSWFVLWFAPGLYFGIVAKQVQDVKDAQTQGQRFEGENEPWVQVVLGVAFWGTWVVVGVVKFGTLLYVTSMSGWWMWALWACWIGFFGW